MDKPNVISLPEVPKVVHPELENHFIVQIDEWAFNPSIIKHEGRTLLAWRTGWHNQSALRIGELDQHYNLIWVRPINTDRLLQAYGHHAGVEDARLFIHHGKLHIAFTLNVVPRDNRTRAFGTMAGQGVLQLDQHFVADQCWVFDGGDRWVKNWQFFSHSGELLAVYETVQHDRFSRARRFLSSMEGS